MPRRFPAIIMLLGGIIAASLLTQSLVSVALALGVILIGCWRSLRRCEAWRLADDITTVRLALLSIVTALCWQHAGAGFSWLIVACVIPMLALDAADGFIARSSTPTAAGAKYDEIVDALAILVLSCFLVPLLGWWALIPGLMFPLFTLVAKFHRPWQAPLPYSFARKVVAALQGPLLLTAGSPLAYVWPWVTISCAIIAYATILWSFGRDVVWLEQQAAGSAARYHTENLHNPKAP